MLNLFHKGKQSVYLNDIKKCSVQASLYLLQKYLIYKGESVFVCVCVCVCVCPVQKSTLFDQSSPNLVWGPNFTRARSQAMFWPPGWTPGVREALNMAWRASTASTMRLGKHFIKHKLQGRSVLGGADLIFGAVIQIWMDLGPMCFWSHGQSFSGKF